MYLSITPNEETKPNRPTPYMRSVHAYSPSTYKILQGARAFSCLFFFLVELCPPRFVLGPQVRPCISF